MKRATLNHPKLKYLCSALDITRREGIGLLTLLWDFTGQYATPGDIGRFSNEEIAIACDWPADRADELVAQLVATGWLDEHKTFRLVVHDWADHCEEWVRKRLKKQELSFVATKARRRRASVATRSRQNLAPPAPAPAPAPSPSAQASPASARTRAEAARTEPAERAAKKSDNQIRWSPDGGWAGITDDDRAKWAVAYPAVDLDSQLARAGEWLAANPTKAKKRNWRRFVVNWLARSQERGGDHGRAGSGGSGGQAPRREGYDKRRGLYAREEPLPIVNLDEETSSAPRTEK